MSAASKNDKSASTSGSSATTEASVLYESSGGARIYKLNRPKALNSLNQEMITSLTDKIKVSLIMSDITVAWSQISGLMRNRHGGNRTNVRSSLVVATTGLSVLVEMSSVSP